MPKLYEITDAYTPEETIDGLPVEPVLPTERPRVIINTAEFDKPKEEVVAPPISGFGKQESDELNLKYSKMHSVKKQDTFDDMMNTLLGAKGVERYQLWPEKVVREALTSAGDIAKPNPYPEGSEQWQFYEDKRQEGMVPAAMAISALAGSGGLAGTGAKAGEVALGATPFLRPALKHKDRLYKGKPGQEHQDIIPKELYEDFRQKAMSGEDLAEYNFGFINDKGHFLKREDALKYGIDTGIIDPHAGRFGALTTTLMADSSKPGVAIEAMAKTANPFYSAVEHTVKNIPQAKMTGEQWLGTLSNKPGVKPEELDWTGLKSFLEENKGKPVSKAQIEEHLAANKMELKEVSKGAASLDKTSPYYDKELERVLNSDSRGTFDDMHLTLSNDAKAYQTLMRKHPELKADNDWASTVLDSVVKGGGNTKYHSYQLPGGENYREMLLTLPTKDAVFDQNLMYYMRKYPQVTSEIKTIEDVALAQKHNPAFRETSKGLSPEEVLATARASEKPTNEAYKSSHWDEPNILAHVRMNDRYFDNPNNRNNIHPGKDKSLHLEEIQSDWHQQGRDRGYKDPNAQKKYDAAYKAVEDARAAFRQREKSGDFVDLKEINSVLDPLIAARAKAAEALTNSIPDAPFKKTWHELALKRMIREAAEKGYDRLSWTPGEAQAARYDLSKQVEAIRANKNSDGTYQIGYKIPGHNMRRPMSEHMNVTADKLPDVVGKELANKILKNEGGKADEYGRVYEGVDLKIGGEGMKGFYDQIIPKALEKLGKEHGVKVKKGNLKGKDFTIREEKLSDGRTIYDVMEDGNLNSSFKTKAEAEKHIASKNKNGPDIFYIDIPQSLKDTAMKKGFPLFSSTPGYMFIPFDGDPFAGNK